MSGLIVLANYVLLLIHLISLLDLVPIQKHTCIPVNIEPAILAPNTKSLCCSKVKYQFSRITC